MDKIILKGLEFECNHGVFDFEKASTQKFIVDCDLYLDLSECIDDNLLVSYADVYSDIKKIMMSNTFNLIEKCALEIANFILKSYSQIKKVDVKVKKPNAPIDGIFDYMGCNIVRTR